MCSWLGRQLANGKEWVVDRAEAAAGHVAAAGAVLVVPARWLGDKASRALRYVGRAASAAFRGAMWAWAEVLQPLLLKSWQVLQWLASKTWKALVWFLDVFLKELIKKGAEAVWDWVKNEYAKNPTFGLV